MKLRVLFVLKDRYDMVLSGSVDIERVVVWRSFVTTGFREDRRVTATAARGGQDVRRFSTLSAFLQCLGTR